MNHTPEPAFRNLDHISSNAQDTSKLAALSARIAELEAQLYAIGAGGVGQSIKPQILADTAQEPGTGIPASVPTGWKLVPVEPTDDMFIEGMEADCRGRPSIDDDNHVRSIWRAMLSSAPDAPPPPAAQQKPVAWLVCSTNPDGSLKVEHAATWKEAAHEHINDAIVEYEVSEAGSWIVQPAYTAPQPTENLHCKSTQKRLATLWGYEKARQPLTNEQITEAFNKAMGQREKGASNAETNRLFVRCIEEAHGITGGQQ